MNLIWIEVETMRAARLHGLTRIQWAYAMFHPAYFVSVRIAGCPRHPVCQGHLLAVIAGKN